MKNKQEERLELRLNEHQNQKPGKKIRTDPEKTLSSVFFLPCFQRTFLSNLFFTFCGRSQFSGSARTLLTFSALFMAIVGCGKQQTVNSSVSQSTLEVQKKAVSEQNISVPRALWKAINERLIEQGASKETLKSYVIEPAQIAVELYPEDPGVLKDDTAVRLEFFEGGGRLDLYQFLKGRGAFRLKFSPYLPSDEPFSWFYISESPGRDYGGPLWGQGCGRVLDLTDQVDFFFGGNGALLSTGRLQYLHLMAGTFVIFQMVENRLVLGYVRVKDSRYPQFQCGG